MTRARSLDRARQGGFTLTELMTVVAIIAVLSTIAWGSLRSEPRPSDAANTAANLIREAARKAVQSGPVRDNVALVLGPARTRIRIFTASGAQHIAVDRLVEDPVPSSAAATWVETTRFTMPRNNVISGWSASADLDGGATPVNTLLGAGDSATFVCLPSGRCDSVPNVPGDVESIEPGTLYFAHSFTTKKARTVMMPLGGSPAVFESW